MKPMRLVKALKVAKAKKMREDGYTLMQIAKKMGYKNHNSITHLLKDKS